MNNWRDFFIREEVSASDGPQIRLLLQATGFFFPFEIDVAIELIEERLMKGPKSGYFFIFLEIEGKIVGFTCYGPIPCTEGSFDLYWIAVHPDFQRLGLGKQLLKKTEEAINGQKGRMIIIETASREKYRPTRDFYIHNGYRIESVIKDFYASDDDKIIFVKKLTGKSV